MFDACVVGLGHIGLPTAALLAKSGSRVAGVDIAPPVLDALRRGETVFPEPGLSELVGDVVASGRLAVFDSIHPASAYLITVPTPIRGDLTCDLDAVIAAAQSVAEQLGGGELVVLESTVPPGTTAGPFAAVFERRGFVPGQDIHIAFCPERALPGHTLREIQTNARLVGGITPGCAAAAGAFYSRFVTGELHPTTATQAEMAKLFENTYRDVNIALANQFAALCDAVGIPARETIALANHHPRVQVHNPGIGVGGHCIPVDPYFLLSPESGASLVTESRNVNNARPSAVAREIEAQARRAGARSVALLGLTYKEDTEDVRDSPAIAVAESIAASPELELVTFDPYIRHEGLRPVSSLAEAVESAGMVVVLVAHQEFVDRLPVLLGDAGPVVVDYTGRIPIESSICPLGRSVAVLPRTTATL